MEKDISSGEVAAVKNAVNAVLSKLGVSGEVTSTTVIPRPNPQIVEAVLK